MGKNEQKGGETLQETIDEREEQSGEIDDFIESGSASRRTSFKDLGTSMWSNGKMSLLIVGGMLTACALYCVLTARVYEARARVTLRSGPSSALDSGMPGGSFASGLVQVETLANEFRSEDLAWDVITNLKLYRTSGSMDRFAVKFPTFDPAQPTPGARGYLLDEFQRDLTVETIPRTLVLQIRFRAHDGALSAQVVNALISAYEERRHRARLTLTQRATTGVGSQLQDLKARTDREERELADFQQKHGVFGVGDTPSGNGIDAALAMGQVNELERELANATTERIFREAEYRAASSGSPEVVLASDAKLQASGAGTLVQHLRTRHSDLEAEQAQLRIEHGPNFPRVLEIRGELEDLDRQIKTEDQKITEGFRTAWRTAADREELVRRALIDGAAAGLKMNQAALQYAARRREADAKHEVYVRVMQQAEEAGVMAGSSGSEISVIDYARQPVKPSSPKFLVYMAITFFASVWIALGCALLRDRVRNRRFQAAVIVAVGMCAACVWGQAPTPSTSGLPTGVARIPQSTETKSQPNPKDAPAVWTNSEAAAASNKSYGVSPVNGVPIAGLIGPGDLLEISEAHTPNQREPARVSQGGSIRLSLAGEVHIAGLDEGGAARAIEQALMDKGMLVRPRVTVLVTAYAGQDVSVLGEVVRPGVYAYTTHHRLLDLVSAASGLSPTAGRLVTIIHRADPDNAVAVVLDATGTDGSVKHNPDLLPGDMVQVSRAGLVYVVGDVVRPGGFAVDPVQATTVVQALSLAWGPGQNAALKKAILIREQPGGRTLTTINLKRMLRGQDPDLPIRDKDILFVPNSMAKNLLNRTLESVIQSAAGVSIYAGLVYSQRF